MRRPEFLRCMLLSLLLACSPAAFGSETIGWSQLVPRLDLPRHRLATLQAGLSLQNKRDLIYLREVLRLRAVGRGSEELTDRERQAVASLAASGVDAEPILREMARLDRLRRENGNKLVETLNGRRVSLTGYLLPLEFSGDKVIEFLLVAEDGACIHTPVPPMNQLVHVKLDEAFESDGLFTPVVVSGVISTGVSSQSVSYSDGVIPVSAGYNMAASEVVRYEN